MKPLWNLKSRLFPGQTRKEVDIPPPSKVRQQSMSPLGSTVLLLEVNVTKVGGASEPMRNLREKVLLLLRAGPVFNSCLSDPRRAKRGSTSTIGQRSTRKLGCVLLILNTVARLVTQLLTEVFTILIPATPYLLEQPWRTWRFR